MMRRQWLARAGGALAVAFLLAWAIGEAAYPHSNPPQRYDGPILSAQSDRLLRGACFDCHSNETRHPWYRHLPLAALLMGIDIREGRSELNFSRWNHMDPQYQRKVLAKALHEVREGDMPPLQYRLMHPQARLDAQEITRLQRDAQARYDVTLAPSRSTGQVGLR
jgi:Haem-binding domain